MAHITPQIHLHKVGEKTKFEFYKTYRELKKDLAKFVKDYDEVVVYRSRRGEWGEWFEYWGLSNGKLEITKKGWQ
jgi:hypothetical protein